MACITAISKPIICFNFPEDTFAAAGKFGWRSLTNFVIACRPPVEVPITPTRFGCGFLTFDFMNNLLRLGTNILLFCVEVFSCQYDCIVPGCHSLIIRSAILQISDENHLLFLSLYGSNHVLRGSLSGSL